MLRAAFAACVLSNSLVGAAPIPPGKTLDEIVRKLNSPNEQERESARRILAAELKDPDVTRRLAAADAICFYLAERKDGDATALIPDLIVRLEDGDETIATRAAAALARMRATAAAPALGRLAMNQKAGLRLRKMALNSLHGLGPVAINEVRAIVQQGDLLPIAKLILDDLEQKSKE